MSSAPRKVLLTGATGYIGGSILSELLSSTTEAPLNNIHITCLVRGENAAEKLSLTYKGKVTPVLFKDLDDTDTVTRVASEHDIVINTLLGYHPSSSAALVKGLGQRKTETGNEVFMIHTSGTSNLADKPFTGTAHPANKVFNDATDDIYGYETAAEKASPYAQRTSELGVIDTGSEHGVKTLVIMSPLIYGTGLGLTNRSSIQIPGLTRATLAAGHGIVAGDGKGVWDNVHIEDLARLYKLVLTTFLDGSAESKGLPSGKKGIIFSGARRHTWREVSQGVADAAAQMGKIQSNEVKSLSLSEFAKAVPFTGGDETLAELGLASNSRTESVVARERLGWKPVKTEEDWKKNFKQDLEVVLEADGE